MNDDIEWLHRFLDASVFGPPPSEIQRAHRIVDALVNRPEEVSRWRDPKVTVPCDGDNVLGLWDGRFEKNVPDVAHYYHGHWCEPGNPVNECEAPKFWMPIPSAPLPQKDKS